MKVSELKKVLELVKPGLARKELLEQSTSIIFRQDQVFTFNDEVAVVVPFDSGITGSVPADPLYSFLNKLAPEAEITVKEGENELTFSCGRNRAGIRRNEEIKLPLDEEIPEPEEWGPLPDGFLNSLRRVLFSCAAGGHRPILTCVHVTDNFIESCDGFRMTRSDCEIKTELDICLVGRNLERLHNYSPTDFGFTENWIQFKNKENVRYAARIVDGEYPDLEKFIKVKGQEIELPSELITALDWASVVADDTIKYQQNVDVEIERGKITVRGEGPEGWAEQTVRMKYTGDPIKFQAHPVLLKEMIAIAGKVIVSKESLKIEADGFVHIVSLDSEKE